MRSRFHDLANVFSWWRDRLLLLLLVLLPWQGRVIGEIGSLGGVPWEPATRSLFATELLLLAALVLQFLHASRKEDHQKIAPPVFLRFWILFLLFGLLSIIWAPDSGAAGNIWVRLFEGFALGYLIWISDLRPAYLLAAFLCGSAGNALLGAWQFLTQSSFASTALGVAAHPAAQAGASVIETASGRFIRAYGLLPHPNLFGGWMALALLAAAALFVRGAGKKTEPWLLGAVALFTAGLGFSFSRSAWLAYAAAFLVLALYRRANLRAEETTRLKKTLWVQLAAGLFVLAVAAPLVLTRVSGQARLETLSVDQRALAVYQSFELIKEHYAFGTGIGNMPLAAYEELRPRLEPYSYQPAHHVILLAFVELGFFGGMVLLGAGWTWLIEARKRLRRAAGALARGIILLPALLIVVSFFDHYTLTQYAGTMLAGLAFGLFLKVRQE